ncbi:MAG: DNA methyltransferase [Ignavibacteria bacterium RIFOXYA2_FULL_35_9]|nr:MAG: DNA methyltransferase [Ignavibacteria bacterium RIFOXYA2_FULL_35_9]
MSRILINQYYTNLERAKHFGKSTNEQSIRNHFWNLLNEYAPKQNYEVATEVSCQGTKGSKVRPDGIVKNLFGLDIGLWESKDEKDTINDEIDTKQKKGYPFYNILFEDSKEAVLFQRGEEVMRGFVLNPDELHKIITEFISFKSDTVYKFEDALEKFKADIPAIVETLRKRIDQTRVRNKNFIAVSATFLELCKIEINPDITEADIREMMIQHILTSDIFNKIFDDPEFHRHNNIARELEKLIEILFTYSERKNLMGNIEHYYDAINSTAAGIVDHHEKQKFLKVLYENFYKVYNPKAADRLGVIYTPNEIVNFMIEGIEYLLHKHFGKTLSDKNVDILDPATGTATFVTSIIDHIPNQDLLYKYKNEIHANEVAILPYYIANLNIEFTFKQKMGYYEEFKNLCFVDTLDNTNALLYSGKQETMFGLSSENSERIKQQNSKKISVVIGNPPYNANQQNENENNKNREYPYIDKRIKDTYIKYSTAQKTKVYDMYARFLRWAFDRVDKNGIVAFVSNNSFINSRTYDGFRKIVAEEFNEIWIIDLKGNARTSGERRRAEGGNVFSDLIRVGVAVYFLVKKENESGCNIFYNEIKDYAKAEEKKEYLHANKLKTLPFQKITPDKNNNWINLADNDFERLVALADNDVKRGNKSEAVFKLFSNGIVTARDEWTFDLNKESLHQKAKYFCDFYKKEKSRWLKSDKQKPINDFVDRTIKWTEELESHLQKGSKLEFAESKIRNSLYRPFISQFTYFDRIITHRVYQNEIIFGIEDEFKNKVIWFSGIAGSKAFQTLASTKVASFDLLEKTQCLPLYRYDSNGNRIDNITDWGLEQFVNHYKDKKIKKEDIFHYVYAVLHNPAYRKKYELNLKREFPRIPFYKDFWQWAKWGKQLMELHINYEKAKPFNLKLIKSETKQAHTKQKEMFSKVEEPETLYAHKPIIKVKLKADKLAGVIEIDELTLLKGIPKQAWEYKLGNRSAIEWILDQYKEKKPKDSTIAENFNTYRFTDYKEDVIYLLKKITTISVETMRIINEMEKEK